MPRIWPRTTLPILLFLLSGVSRISAQETWNNSGAGDWFNAANWIPQTVPSSSTTATVDDGGTSDIAGAGAAAAAGALYVGNAGMGAVSIQNGATLTESGYLGETYLGYAKGSNGSMTVDGANSTWTSQAYYADYIGDAGTGSLTIQNGGYAAVPQAKFCNRRK